MSDIRTLCQNTYKETIESLDINPQLRRALRTHERVPGFIDNLARELSMAKFTVKKEDVIMAVRDMTKNFCSLVERQASERMMSRLAVGQLKKAADAKVKFQENVETLEGLGHDNVVQTQKGTTIKQTISVDKNLETLKEITET